MTTTVRELLEKLKHYPLETVVAITDVDDEEFAIVDFIKENGGLTMIIGVKEHEEEEEDGEGE